jgi:riboflavin kinase/FMN adenylyltransferase
MQRFFRDVAGGCLAPRGSVVCVGAFDGVHRGHRAVLNQVRERARALDLAAIAITFEPVPREYFARTAGTAGLPRLTGAGEKRGLLFEAGMDVVLSLRFDAALAAMSAEDFAARVLRERVDAREIRVGAEFRFGHRRAGDVALLRRLGFATHEVAPFEVGGERVSSSRLRRLLGEGDFDAAAVLLGRRFAIGGHVVRGAQLGRKLGYPTANLRLGRRVAPVQGVFAVRVHGGGLDAHPAGRSSASCARDTGASLPGVASLGVRPTVNGTEPLLEAHLFDFDGDLYGRRIEVEFVAKLRDEEKFPDLETMVRQIDLDAAMARRILGVAAVAGAGV